MVFLGRNKYFHGQSHDKHQNLYIFLSYNLLYYLLNYCRERQYLNIDQKFYAIMTKNAINRLKFSLFIIGVSILIIFVSATIGSFSFYKALAQNTFASVSSLDQKGDDLYDSGNSTGAIIFYNKALALNATDTNALNGKGAILSDSGNSTGALIFYNKALAIDPKDVDALTGKGFALDDLGNSTGALIFYNKALAIDPKNPDVLKAKSELAKAAKSK
jgi:tetratricopeptide (TPR) repeat protein